MDTQPPPNAGEPIDHAALFEKLEKYPWDSDEEFQSGLSAILGSKTSSDQLEALTIRARCFYFSRKFNIPVDFPSYCSWRNQENHPPTISSDSNGPSTPSISRIDSSGNQITEAPGPATSPDLDPPYPTSFSHIVDLITTGKPIPGIEDIPDIVLEGQGPPSAKQKRKKPWEKDDHDMMSSGEGAQPAILSRS
ncbi:MAG: hypothetical protein M1834_001720 [Cirrosporium novae-zelandiae]|nr:MAG: hypothetical protein M1834_001720 [Cirrosporium novae-zelandiae]